MEASVQPITRTVLRVRLVVTPDFRWHDQVNTKPLDPSLTNVMIFFFYIIFFVVIIIIIIT